MSEFIVYDSPLLTEKVHIWIRQNRIKKDFLTDSTKYKTEYHKLINTLEELAVDSIKSPKKYKEGQFKFNKGSILLIVKKFFNL